MAEAAADVAYSSSTGAEGHRVWVRICHWTLALAVLVLAVTGFIILMVQPRLYWGEVGNDLTPALIELPISGNHRPEGWERTAVFASGPDAPVSANRTYAIFNQNGWGRSLHFLAAWIFVVTLAGYAFSSLLSGHLRKLLPRLRDLAPRSLAADLTNHLRGTLANAGGGPPYGLLQRCAYSAVLFVVLPLMVLTGLAMAPAVTAAYPLLLDLFGGYQSARTVHFFGFTALVLFLITHIAMVGITGFRRQLRAMVLGR